MSLHFDEYLTLVQTIYENGEEQESYGLFDEDAKEGHFVELIEHEGIWLVFEQLDDQIESIKMSTDETDARGTFSNVKKQIENEELSVKEDD